MSAPLARARRAAASTPDGAILDEAESPLFWLSRRTGRDGRPLVDAAQLAAGERLRLDFTRAGLTPRVTADWSRLGGGGASGGGGPVAFADAVLAARARLARALAAVGPELSGVLLDVCCFLKGLEQVERERGWPARTAKVVLGIALDRLARHYGLAAEARGHARSTVRAWRAPPAAGAEEEAGAHGEPMAGTRIGEPVSNAESENGLPIGLEIRSDRNEPRGATATDGTRLSRAGRATTP